MDLNIVGDLAALMATEHDPNTMTAMMVADDGDVLTPYSLDKFRACALLCEGFMHRYCDVPSSISAMGEAIKLHPENYAAVHILGHFQAQGITQ